MDIIIMECQGCVMLVTSHVKRLSIAALLTLAIIPGVADAKGGHSSGRGHGARASTGQPITQTVIGDPPAPAAAAVAATSTAKAVPSSSLNAASTIPVPPSAPVPMPASVIGMPAPQPSVVSPPSVPIPIQTALSTGGSGGVSLSGGGKD